MAEQGAAVSSTAELSSAALPGGAVVLRVKRRVTEEPLPALALHAKKLRLQAAGGAAVFRLAGTFEHADTAAALQRALATAIQGPAPKEPRHATPQGPPDRRRKRYRIVSSVELSGGEQRAQKRKRQSQPGAAVEDGKIGNKRSKGVHVFDVEFDSGAAEAADGADSSQEDRCGKAQDEYQRQLESITMNDQQLLCSDATSDVEAGFVYDLYLSNTGPGGFVITSDFGTDMQLDDDEDSDDAGGWAFLLDGFEENYNFPNEYRQQRGVFEDADSDADSESNWRSEYPDAVGFEERDGLSDDDLDLLDRLWMGDRERLTAAKDSDDDLGSYAYDDDLERGVRQMDLSRVKLESEESEDSEEEDLEKARERRHRADRPPGKRSVRQMHRGMLRERSNLA